MHVCIYVSMYLCTHTHTHTQTHTRVGAEIRKALDTVDLIFFYEISSSPHERFRTAYLEVEHLCTRLNP